MALMVREQLGIEKTGTTTSVADDARARMMYYLSCVSGLIDLDDPTLRRLCDYEHYYTLSGAEESAVLLMAALLSPDELHGKVIFQNDDLCGDSGNEFYSLSRAKHMLAVTDSILIGGQQKSVTKIMTFKMSWLRKNYIEPLVELHRRHEARKAATAKSGCCIIL